MPQVSMALILQRVECFESKASIHCGFQSVFSYRKLSVFMQQLLALSQIIAKSSQLWSFFEEVFWENYHFHLSLPLTLIVSSLTVVISYQVSICTV